MSSQKLIRQTTSLSTSNISANRSMTFWRNQIPSTSNDMINIVCHTSFRWVRKFSCICRENALSELIGRLDHSDMVLTQLPRMWETILLSSTFPHSLAHTQCSMCTTIDHTSHHYWTHQRLQDKFSRWRNSMQWGPLLPKGGGMIQVDVGGHPPIPFGPPQLSLSAFSVSLIVAQLTIFRSSFGSWTSGVVLRP